MAASRVTRAAGAAAITALALSAAAAVGAGSAEAITVSPGGSVTLTMLGNGHGHGMSQYGARGAAIAGRSGRQIVHFYYPGSRLVTERQRRIRVQLSGVGSRLTVFPAADLTVTDIADPLPKTGISRYRLQPGSGTGLTLQRLESAPGSGWTTVRTKLPDGAAFRRATSAPVRVAMSDGTSRAYYGLVSAWRNTASGLGGGVTTVNRVGLDNYTAGVVPSEMPTSWQQAAVNAQAIAARTYGAYGMAHPMSRRYDICDTTWCQVYGGHAHYDSASRLTWSDYPRAATATANEVLEYNGSPIFAQFAASNGGWTVAGGQPYLIAQADPYDNASSGDPYLYYRKTVSVASVAGYFGLKSVTQVAVTERDGNGTWNGRVLSGYVQGVDMQGRSTKVPATGSDFAGAFGIGTTWFRLSATT